MLEKVIGVVMRCAQTAVERERGAVATPLSAESRLVGRDGLFDSLGLVSMIVDVEEALADELGCTVSLADERAMSQTHSPFRTIRTLAEYAASQMEGRDGRGG